MKKKYMFMCSLVICCSIFAGCTKAEANNREVIEKEGKTITVINDTKDAVYEDIAVKKIDVYDEMKGFGWTTDDKIVVGMENKELYSKVDEHVSSIMRNLYLYDIQTKEKKLLGDKSQCQEYAIVSPDKKHILYRGLDLLTKEEKGYIADMDGNIKAAIEGPYINEFGEAVWDNNNEVIIPFKESGFCFANVDGTTNSIENIEYHQIKYAVKIENKVYYTTYNKKMKVYDINTKKSILFQDNVINFYLSPDKKQLILSKHFTEEDKNVLVLTDLDGNNKETLVEGRFIYGINWSPDGTKVAYMLNKGTNEDVGFYIMNMENKIQSFISKEYFGQGEPIWSPSSKKIMINMDEQKDEQSVETVHVITLK